MEQAIEDINITNKPGTANTTNTDTDTDTNLDGDTNRVANPGIDTEGAKSINNNGNSKTRCPNIISFSINNIIGHSYSMLLIIEIMKLKNLLRFK